MKPEQMVLQDLQANGPGTMRDLQGRVKGLRPVDLSNTVRRMTESGAVVVDRAVNEDGHQVLTYRLP